MAVADNWQYLWKDEKCTCQELTGNRRLRDWEGYSDGQDERRHEASNWVKARIDHIQDALGSPDDAEEHRKQRLAYLQAIVTEPYLDKIHWTVPEYPRVDAYDDEAAYIKERAYYCSLLGDPDNTPPNDQIQHRKKQNFDWINSRRQHIQKGVDGKVSGQPAGWDHDNRRQRYDNLQIANHYGGQYEDWRKGKYVPVDERGGGGDGSTRHRLSEHFTVEEFDCHDGTKCGSREYDGLEALCKQMLEPLRDEYGSVHINSGYRTPSYNASVGGASDSFHIYTNHDGNDQAADITCASGSPSQWHSTLNWLRANKRGGNGGLGLYSTFVHVDLRDYPANWTG